MAMITCPECKKEISDKAKICPYCGYPFGEQENNIEEIKEEQNSNVDTNIDSVNVIVNDCYIDIAKMKTEYQDPNELLIQLRIRTKCTQKTASKVLEDYLNNNYKDKSGVAKRYNDIKKNKWQKKNKAGLNFFVFILLCIAVFCAYFFGYKKNDFSDIKRLFVVEVTIPKEAVFGTNDSEKDNIIEKAKENAKFMSVTENEDGSITYKMTSFEHKKMMKELDDSLEDTFKDICDKNDYKSIKRNDDCSEFTVVTESTSVNLIDSINVLGFYLTGCYYQLFNGNEDYNVKIIFKNYDTKEVIETFNLDDYVENKNSGNNYTNENTQNNNDEVLEKHIGETLYYCDKEEDKDIKSFNITMDRFEENTGGNFNSPQMGNVFVYVHFNISNSYGKLFYFNEYNFNPFADGKSITKTYIPTDLESYYKAPVVEIPDGKSTEGWVVFEAPMDWKRIDLYYDNADFIIEK